MPDLALVKIEHKTFVDAEVCMKGEGTHLQRGSAVKNCLFLTSKKGSSTVKEKICFDNEYTFYDSITASQNTKTDLEEKSTLKK